VPGATLAPVEREEMRRGRIQLAEDIAPLEGEELWSGEDAD